MRPRRVLLVGHRAELAGAEVALANFAAHLDRSRFVPSVLLPNAGPVCGLLESHHIPYYCLPAPSYTVTSETPWDSPANLRAIRPLRDAITALAPDVIVVNTNTIPQVCIAALTTNIPLAVHLHAFVTRRQSSWLSNKERTGDQMWLQFADGIMACSTWVAGFYETLLERPIKVVPNTTTVDDATGAAPMPPCFVMLATLEDHKRADLFIEAAALVCARQPEMAFECRLYGDGAREQREKLQHMIEQRGLGEVFKLFPAQSETAAIYREATCAVVPSDIEPFSMVCIEAAAHGRPVIATRSGGPQDIVADGETGFLIETGDAGALADAMLRITGNPAMTTRMGGNARAHFERYYAPEAVMPQYEAVLDAAISQPSGERRRIGQITARYFMTRHEA